MREGEFPDGSRVLRAKIDMASPNINMRDPVIYRIQRATHHRTGDEWCIYPMYDFAHPLSDAIEGITHSLCTLEFEDHRPLYNWFLETLEIQEAPQQIEFARLELTHVVTSKRRLRRLVEEGYVSGWDDPRMPTLAALRRRGYTPKSIREFCRSGRGLKDQQQDRPRPTGALRPGGSQPHGASGDGGSRSVAGRDRQLSGGADRGGRSGEQSGGSVGGEPQGALLRVIYIERDDFLEDPPKKFFRLAPGREVRLKGAYYITCENVIKDPETGEIVELHCVYDPESRGGNTPDGRKVRGTLHWVSAAHAVPAEVRLYEQLFLTEDPEEGGDYIANLNPNSLRVISDCLVEPSLQEAAVGDRFQFLRHGYFCVDPDSTEERRVFNRTVSLRDTWAKVKGK